MEIHGPHNGVPSKRLFEHILQNSPVEKTKLNNLIIYLSYAFESANTNLIFSKTNFDEQKKVV